jgi:hypothetical protein
MRWEERVMDEMAPFMFYVLFVLSVAVVVAAVLLLYRMLEVIL